jgi:hypothetical protein
MSRADGPDWFTSVPVLREFCGFHERPGSADSLPHTQRPPPWWFADLTHRISRKEANRILNRFPSRVTFMGRPCAHSCCG